jgi:O-Antigen ligase
VRSLAETGARAGKPQGAVSSVFPAVSRRMAREKKFDAVTLLTVYLALLMFIPAELVFGPLGGAGTPATVFALCILLWYIASWIAGRITPAPGGRPIRVAMFAFALCVLASFAAAMTRDITQPEVLAADRGLIIITAWSGLVVVACRCVTTYDRLDTLLRRAVVFGSVVAAIGVLQFYTGLDVTKFIKIPGLTASVDINTLLARDGFNRPSSTATQPIEFGVVMAMLLPFAIQQAFDPARGGRFRRWAPVFLMSAAIPMSLSRSGILGVGVAMLFLLPTWNARRRWTGIVVIILGLGAMKAAAPGLLGTLTKYFSGLFGSNNSDISVVSRTNDYAGVAQYVAERPIFGRGFGTFMPELYRFTDNTYLLGVVEFGFVGLVALLVLFFTGMHCAAAGRRRTKDEHRREIGQALKASIAVGLVSSATFDALTFRMFSGLLFPLLGCAGAYLAIMTEESRTVSLPPLITETPSAGLATLAELASHQSRRT